jgi:hypothetical protein
MNYWHIQLHPDDRETISSNVAVKILQDKSVIGVGDWDAGRALIDQFKNEMQVGDIVVVKDGSTPIALTKVKGDHWFEQTINEEFDWFPHRREVEVLEYFKPSQGFSIPQSRGTLSICRDLSSETSKIIINWHKRYMENKSKEAPILLEDCISLIKHKKQIILQGPPGTGKTRQAELIAKELTKPGTVGSEGEFQIIQFHPAYSYEDFVRGIIAKTTESGNVLYQVENKILTDFAQKAKDNPNGNYVLVIDEINRANLPSVLGELIYALEYRDKSVTSLYEYEGERKIVLPKNLYIIGTMNTADRSVGHIDYAIRRRFAFVDILPDENVIEYEGAKKLFNSIKNLFTAEFLSPEFKSKEVMIGHSYFLAKDDNKMRIKLEYEIKPILREYLKDGIFFEAASKEIESLNV